MIQTRTGLTLYAKKGIVCCYCGTLIDFIDDVTEYILPMLGDNITIEFNYKQVEVNSYDTAESILAKFKW